MSWFAIQKDFYAIIFIDLHHNDFISCFVDLSAFLFKIYHFFNYLFTYIFEI